MVFLVSSVKISRNSSEFKQVVVLSGFGQANLVNVFIVLDRFPERFIILSFKEEVIKGFIDSLNILVLNALQEVSNNSQVASVLDLKF